MKDEIASLDKTPTVESLGIGTIESCCNKMHQIVANMTVSQHLLLRLSLL